MVERYTLDLGTLKWRHDSQRQKALPKGLPPPHVWDPIHPEILFQTQTYAPWTNRICAMRPDGSGFRYLTANLLQNEDDPAWSPTQNEVIFVHGPDGASQLWVMKWDGTGQQQLTFPPAGQFDAEPAMSPDRTKIAFQRFYQLWLVNANGTNPRPLLDYSAQPQPAYVQDRHPTWSPDGSTVAFNRQAGGQGLICTATIRANPNGWNDVLTEVADGFPLWPSWYPGTKIVYRSEADWNAFNIRSYDPVSGQEVVLSHPGIDQLDMWPSWSSDGTQIAFQRIGYSQQPNPNAYLSHIWIMRGDGTGEEDVTALRITQNPNTPASDWTPNWT